MNDPHGRTDPDALSASLREELKVGVRMMKALESQLERAERVIRLETDAACRADETLDRLQRGTDALEAMRRHQEARSQDETQAVLRIEGLATDLGARLDAQAARIAELDATMSTLERRLDRLTDDGATSATSSGSLSLTATPTESTDDRHPEGLRMELEAVRRVSASLAEAVEAAERTDERLKRTLDAAANLDRGTATRDAAPNAAGIATILRKLADEFEGGIASPGTTTSTSSEMATVASSGVTVTHPLELELELELDPTTTPPSDLGSVPVSDPTEGRG